MMMLWSTGSQQIMLASCGLLTMQQFADPRDYQWLLKDCGRACRDQ